MRSKKVSSKEEKLNFEDWFHEVHSLITAYTNVTANALAEKFGGKYFEKDDIERLHRHTEFLTAYLFEKVFRINKLCYKYKNNESYMLYQKAWLDILAPISDEINLVSEDSSPYQTYFIEHKDIQATIEESEKEIRDKEYTDLPTNLHEVSEQLNKRLKKITDSFLSDPLIKSLLDHDVEKFDAHKDETFKIWFKHNVNASFTDTFIENNVKAFDRLSFPFKKKKFDPDNHSCWFALHFWHPRKEFANSKLLLLIGTQWDLKLHKLMKIFPYLPITLPKIAFNPDDTSKFVIDSKIYKDLCEVDKKYPSRQGVIVITKDKKSLSKAAYLKRNGLLYDRESDNAKLFYQVKNGELLPNKRTCELFNFLDKVRTTDENEIYLSLIAGKQFWKLFSEYFNKNKEAFNIKNYKDNSCQFYCNESCRGISCFPYLIHECVNVHLTPMGGAFLLQSLLTWDWENMYMFPGALWHTTIGGIGCSFLEPLDDYEFQCMRILVRDMLSPYSLLEREMLELSEEKKDYFKKLEKGRDITSGTIVSAYKMSQEISNLSRDYLNVTDTSLTEEIWYLFKEKALCLISHAGDSKTNVINKYKDNTIEKLIEIAKREINNIMFPDYTKRIDICSFFENKAREEEILDKKYDKNDAKQKKVFSLCQEHKEKNYKIKLHDELEPFIKNIDYGDYVLLVHDNKFFSDQLKALFDPIDGIKKIIKTDLVIEKEYKLKHLILLTIKAKYTEEGFNPSGNLEGSLNFLKDCCYMGYIMTNTDCYEKKPLSNKETEKIYNKYYTQHKATSRQINIMFCFSRGVD